MSSTLVELHVPDFDVAKSFYSKLSFQTVWETAPERKRGYLVLALEDNRICFWGGNEEVYNQSYFKNFDRATPRGYGVEIVLQVSNLREYYGKVCKEIEPSTPLEMRPWGLEDFRIVDPFGFYIRVTSRFDIDLP